MTRTKESVGKHMRSQINEHLTPGERTFCYYSKLKEVTGQVYFTGGGEEARGLGRSSRRRVASTRGSLATKTLSDGHEICILSFGFLLYKYARHCAGYCQICLKLCLKLDC